MPLLRAPGYVGVPSRRFLCWWWLIYGVCERSRLSGCSGFRYGFREQHHGVPKDTENPHRSTQTSSLPNRLGRYAPSPSRWLTHEAFALRATTDAGAVDDRGSQRSAPAGEDEGKTIAGRCGFSKA
jgi:hypothetical protein